MADPPFPIPEDWPEARAFADGLDQLRRKWPFQEVALPAVQEPPQFAVTGRRTEPVFLKGYLKGYWSNYPTYCLTAYPTPAGSYFSTFDTLKKVLIACHLLLLQGIDTAEKHYISRLRTSFRAYRTLYQKAEGDLVALLPPAAQTLTEYADAIGTLLERRNEQDTLQAIRLALEGALEGRGGHTRTVNREEQEKVVGQNEQTLAHDDSTGVKGRLIRDQKKINHDGVTTANRLAREESNTGSLVLQSDESINPERGDSVPQALRNAKGQKASLMRQNQLLAFGWPRLSLIDIRAWFDNLAMACEKICLKHDMAAEELRAFCGLMFWTGHLTDDLCELLVVGDYSSLPSSTPSSGYIVKDSALAVFPKLRVEGAKELSSKWRAYVRGSADRIILPLPHAAREQIVPWLDNRAPSGRRGKRLFRKTPDSYRNAIKALASEIRQWENGARVTAVRLLRQLPLSLANQCGDRVRAAAAMGMAVTNHTTTGVYYYSSTQSELASVYWRTAARLSDYLVQSREPERLPALPAGTTHTYVGSNVCPDDGRNIGKDSGFYPYHVQDLRNALEYCRSRRHKPDFSVRFHNAYTNYCVAMLGAITGYRAVKNPLSNIRALDEPTGFLVISDKDFDDYRNARLTWVPPLLSAQLRAYAAHRAILIRAFQLEHADLSFFFFLDSDRRGARVTPKSLAESLQWTSKLPLNANRHYLRTRLTEKRVPGEMIDAFMGHWDIGEEPYGPYSGVSPIDFKCAIKPALSQILSEQGWRVEHAVEPDVASTISLDIPHNSNAPPSKSTDRSANAALKRKRTLERVHALLSQYTRRGDSGMLLSKPDSKALFRSLRDDASIHDWRFAHNRLAQLLTTNAQTHRWQIGEIPSSATLLPRSPAAFTPELFRGLADFRQIERGYIQSLRELNPCSCDRDEIVARYTAAFENRRSHWTPDLSTLLIGQILFAAARFGGLLSKAALQDLLAQLPAGGMVIRDHLVFDLTCPSLKRRWYADPLSCILILRYRDLVDRGHIPTYVGSSKDALKAILRGIVGKTHPLDGVPAFLKSAAVAWQFDQPAFLYRWARNVASSCSWDEKTEMRVRFDRRILHRKTKAQTEDGFGEVGVDVHINDNQKPTTAARVSCDLNRAYIEFYKRLHVNTRKAWRKQIRHQLDAWLETNSEDIGPLPTLFVQYTRAIASGHAGVHQTVGAASSVRAYVSRVGRILFTQSKEFGSAEFYDLGAWKQLYRSVVESKRGPLNRMHAATECQRFHNYAVREMDAPTLAVGEAVGVGPTHVGAAVDANYVTPFELERAVALLRQNAQRDRNCEIACHALVLGYWSGLRIGELVALELRDIQIAWTSGERFKRVEILVRTHDGRKKKSATSTRRVPVSCLMPKESLARFVRFIAQRKQDCDDSSRSGKEFVLSTPVLGRTLPNETEIRRLVQFALRQVTGDATLVFHQLRHSATNNMLMALMARSDDDPIWRIFPRKPESLLDVSRRINRGLMVNTNRRRGLLHAVETLLGHSEPHMTLQSYIHILPWISAVRASSAETGELYTGLERGVELDSSLLAKPDNATRSWRSRHDSGRELQPIADYWLKKFRSQAKPSAYKRTGKPLATMEHDLSIPARPLPSFHAIYHVALLVYQAEFRAGRQCSNAELARVASQAGVQHWLVIGLIREMRYAAQQPALRCDTVAKRVRGKARFEDERLKYFRGHGPVELSVLDQRPELFGLMPAFPRTEADLASGRQIWAGLLKLLEPTGIWQQINGEPVSEPDTAANYLLSSGLEIFMERTNSSDHTMKFSNARGGLDDARLYIAFAKRISPHNRVMVELMPSPNLTVAKALATARKELDLAGCASRPIKQMETHWQTWPYGLPSVRLLSVAADEEEPRTLDASYGAWFAQFTFALLKRSLRDVHAYSEIFTVQFAGNGE